MSAEIDAYKVFVDGLVHYRGSVAYILNAFMEKRWNHPSSQLLDDLPDNVRQAIASVIRKAAEAATHDVLVYMTDEEYSLVRLGVTLADRPFDNALYDDFIARKDDIPWPDEPSSS